MKGKNRNSQVLDLRNIPCPMNLVQFKYHLYERDKNIFYITKNGDAFNNICHFLEFKKIVFTVEEKKRYYIIMI